MPLEIADTSIERVRIIDDEPDVREVYRYPVEELDLEPIPVEGPLPDLNDFVIETITAADAVICDYKLRIRNYANFDGAETVARLYKEKFPAILCTKWELAGLDEMRKYRRFIPVLLSPDELDPDSIVQGFQQCIEEFTEIYKTNRRSWRTLVRVEDFDTERQNLYIVIPAWDPSKVIRLMGNDLPSGIIERLGDQTRFHAHVNVGAERNEDLFFEKWEVE